MTILKTKEMLQNLVGKTMEQLGFDSKYLFVTNYGDMHYFYIGETDNVFDGEKIFVKSSICKKHSDGYLLSVNGSFTDENGLTVSGDVFASEMNQVANSLGLSLAITVGKDVLFSDSEMKNFYETKKYLSQLENQLVEFNRLKRYNNNYSVYTLPNYKNKKIWLNAGGYELGRFSNLKDIKVLEDKLYLLNNKINQYLKNISKGNKKSIRKDFYFIYDGMYFSVSTSTDIKNSFAKGYVQMKSEDTFEFVLESYEDNTSLNLDGKYFSYPFFRYTFEPNASYEEIESTIYESFKQIRIDEMWRDSYAFELDLI